MEFLPGKLSYIPAKVLGIMSVGLDALATVENITGAREAAPQSYETAGQLMLGAVLAVGAGYIGDRVGNRADRSQSNEQQQLPRE